MSVSRKWFGRKSATPRRLFRRAGIEALEPRQLLSTVPTLAPLGDVTLLANSPLHIPLDGFDSDGLPVSFQVEISNNTASLTTFMPQGNRSMKISVPGHGDMVFELFESRAPRVTHQIIALAESGFYDGLIFHRVIDDFMIQGGCPNGIGDGSSSMPDIDDQFHVDLQHNRGGLLSMAKSGDDTNNSQFFITELDTRHLDYNHSIFGLLIEGEDVRETISEVAVNGSTPITPVVMESVEIYFDNQNATLMLKAPEGITGEADITITIIDHDGTEYVQPSFHVTVEPDVTPGLPWGEFDVRNSDPYLPDIAPIITTVDTQIEFQVPLIDADGVLTYFDTNGIEHELLPWYADEELLYNYRGNDGIEFLSYSHVDLSCQIDQDTGWATITPTNGLVGVHPVSMAVILPMLHHGTILGFDSQLVPVVIQPTDLVDPESRLEMSIVQTPTATDAFGEIEQLPESVEWMDEWESFSVEIWASTLDHDEFGIHTAAFDLTYNTDYYTAVEIEYGDMFNQDRTGTILDATGRVDNIGGRTPMYALTQTPGYYSQDPDNLEKFGDDKPVLVARVHFAPNATGGGVPMIADGGYMLPVQDLGLTIENAQVGWNVAATTTVEVGDVPSVDVWPMMYDNDESGKVDLGDLAFFAQTFRANVGEMPLAWKMDYDRSGKIGLGDLSFFAANFRNSAVDPGIASYPAGFPEDWLPVASMSTSMTTAPGEAASGPEGFAVASDLDGFAWAQSRQAARLAGDSSDKIASIVDLLMRTEEFYR